MKNLKKLMLISALECKWRFHSPCGQTDLTLEQLFQLPENDVHNRVANLEAIEYHLAHDVKKVKNSEGEWVPTEEDANKLAIVQGIIKYKQEQKAARARKIKAQQEAKVILTNIDKIKAGNIVDSLKDLTPKELEKAEQDALNKLK